jgi:hypothetical protein
MSFPDVLSASDGSIFSFHFCSQRQRFSLLSCLLPLSFLRAMGPFFFFYAFVQRFSAQPQRTTMRKTTRKRAHNCLGGNVQNQARNLFLKNVQPRKTLCLAGIAVRKKVPETNKKSLTDKDKCAINTLGDKRKETPKERSSIWVKSLNKGLGSNCWIKCLEKVIG